jgi:hypothetical protein
MGSRTGRWAGLRALATLALVVALGQACSDNKGPAGPKFPAGQTGTSDSGVIVFVGINPNNIEPGRRAGVTVVARTPNGRGIPGLHVQLSTTIGKLDIVDGFTDADGKFVSFLFIGPVEALQTTSGTVTALVEGVTGSATVTVLAPSAGEGLGIQPPGITRNVPAGGAAPGTCPNIGSFEVTFTATGGAPPYNFSVSGDLGGTFSGGRYRVGPKGPVIGGSPPLTDVVVVQDAAGQSATATITVSCGAAG